MNEEKILSIDEIIKLELLKIGHQLSVGTLPINLSRDFKKDHLSNSLIKEHNSENCHKRDLYLPRSSKSIGKMSTFVRLCKKELFDK